MVDGKNFFNQPVKTNLRTYESIWKIAHGQGDDCMTAIYLSKQQTLDVDPKATQQNNFTGNLAHKGIANTVMFFIIEETKETILHFSQGTVKVLWIYLTLI